MTPEVDGRLRARVAAILAGAGVSGHTRDDLEEELLGHLVERWRAHVADGLDEGAAAERTIADFGTPARLGAELGRTYHSRLWASTIGVLLPAMAPTTATPGVVGWLRFVLALVCVLTALLTIALPSLTPLRALGDGITAVVSLGALVLAYRALGRGQRWALYYAIGIAVILLGEGIWHFLAPEQPGSINIPLGAILAASVIWSVQNHWSDLRAFVAPSARLNRAFGVALAISLLAPPIVPRALAALPDPTQATANDLELLLTMRCDRGDVPQQNGSTLRDVRRATLVVDATWSRTDLLPFGVGGWLARGDDADMSGLRVISPVRPILPTWLWANGPTTVDLATGASIGLWGSTSSGWALLPEDVIGTFTVAIDDEDIHADHTIRTTWVLISATDAEPRWPDVEVFYAHLDRFALAGKVGCNGISHGVPIDAPPPAPLMDDGLFSALKIGSKARDARTFSIGAAG